MLLIILVVVLAAAASIIGTSQTEFCKSCHEMNSDYFSWMSSKHSEVGCASCHIGSGVLNTVSHKVAAINEVVAHFTSSNLDSINMDSEVSKLLPSRNCLSCHKPPTKKDFGSYIFEHKKHQKTNCAFCHNRTAHSKDGSYQNRLEMKSCTTCHLKKSKSVKCDKCHILASNKKPQTHFADNWMLTHKSPVTITCTNNCHDKAYCNKCHSEVNLIPSTHRTGKWSLEHRKSAKKSCSARCHDRLFCSECHVRKSNR